MRCKLNRQIAIHSLTWTNGANVTINQHKSFVKFMDGTYESCKVQTAYLEATRSDAVDNCIEILNNLEKEMLQ